MYGQCWGIWKHLQRPYWKPSHVVCTISLHHSSSQVVVMLSSLQCNDHYICNQWSDEHWSSAAPCTIQSLGLLRMTTSAGSPTAPSRAAFFTWTHLFHQPFLQFFAYFFYFCLLISATTITSISTSTETKELSFNESLRTNTEILPSTISFTTKSTPLITTLLDGLSLNCFFHRSLPLVLNYFFL